MQKVLLILWLHAIKLQKKQKLFKQKILQQKLFQQNVLQQMFTFY